MPAEAEGPDHAPVQVKVSAPNELAFALYVAHQSVHRPGRKWTQAWVPLLTGNHAELAGRVSGFWADGFPEWLELLLLAQAGGRLWDTDLAPLLEQLPALEARGVRIPELASEPPEVRQIVAERIERLRTDAELRSAYAQLMKDVWAVLRPHWTGGARRVAERMADDFRRRLAAASDFRELLAHTHFALRESYESLVRESLERGEVVIVPLALAGIGVGFFSLPGALIVAQGPEAGSKTGLLRQEAERVASKFKVLSDPTRILILAALINHPYSVTDLAGMFELSQPTVSVHVKLLREAGLLESHRVRGQTLYRGSPQRLQELVTTALGGINC